MESAKHKAIGKINNACAVVYQTNEPQPCLTIYGPSGWDELKDRISYWDTRMSEIEADKKVLLLLEHTCGRKYEYATLDEIPTAPVVCGCGEPLIDYKEVERLVS